MNEKLSCIYIGYTGHIISSLTRSAAPEITIGRSSETALMTADLEQLIGDELEKVYIDNSGLYVTSVPRAELQIVTTDFKSADFDKLCNPYEYHIEINAPIKSPLKLPDQKLDSFITINSNGIEVSVPSEKVTKKRVWILINPPTNDPNNLDKYIYFGELEPAVTVNQQGVITNLLTSRSKVNLEYKEDITFSADKKYNFLILVEGFRPWSYIQKEPNHPPEVS